MFSPITTSRKIRKIAVYDAEWIPGTLETRLVGRYDGEQYRSWATFDAFLDDTLVNKYCPYWLYAHAGGSHDVQFVLHRLQFKPGYSASATFSGSSAVIVKIRRKQRAWTFLDSYFVLPGSLKDIAKSIGEKKTGAAELETEEERIEWYRSAPFDELREYNRNDCEVLHKALVEMQHAVLDLGGQLQATRASTAMHLYRRKYLKTTIIPSELINEKAEKAYTASRVEVYDRTSLGGKYYDINSSFPAGMLPPLPGSMSRNSNTLSDSSIENELCLVRAKVHVPDMYLPPLPKRVGNRVFFPTGTWEGWFTGPDLKLLLEVGGSILKVFKCYDFEPEHSFGEFINELYGIRKSSTDEFQKYALKIMMNSAYGKTAEGREKTQIHYHPSPEVLKRLPMSAMLTPGIWLESTERLIPHRHVPMAAIITARARAALYRWMDLARIVHYTDTDGFATQATLPTSDEIGGLKLEKKFFSESDEPELCEWIAPKLYRTNGKVWRGKTSTWEHMVIVKAKGFPLRDKDPDTVFERIKAGFEIPSRRMLRIMENLSGPIEKRTTQPKEVNIAKRYRGLLQSKRYEYPDGSTRPWSVPELED